MKAPALTSAAFLFSLCAGSLNARDHWFDRSRPENADPRVDALQGEVRDLKNVVYEMNRQVREMSRQIDQLNRRPAPPASSPAPSRGGSYQVQPGDTLSEIAEAYGMKTKELMALNPGVDPRRLQVGQDLRLAHGQTRGETASRGTRSGGNYTVQPGDTLSEIAAAYGVRTRDLQEANPGIDPRRLRVGDSLHVPGRSLASSPPSSQGRDSRPAASPVRSEERTRETRRENVEERTPQARPEPARSGSYGDKRLILIQKPTRYLSIARENGTSVATLNMLNNVRLSSNQLIAEGSELYIPR
ncbi:MAG: LysM peptidoglycan-binding domain-containing protein, partial [Verrucomicrobiales bacterium]